MPRLHEIYEYRFVEPGYKHPKGYDVVAILPGTTQIEMRHWGLGGAISQPLIDLIAGRMEDAVAKMVNDRCQPAQIYAARATLRSEKRTILVKIRIPV